MIPYGRQSISQADIDAVVETLRSDWITQGPAIDRFEQAVCDYTGAAHGVAVNSATSALHIACMALGLRQGDRLWTVPNSFVASSNCGLYCGATVDFVDIDAATFNISVDALQAKLQQASADNSLPSVVVVVHFAGQSCDMQAIHALAQEYGFRVIEDASHAIGGRYGDKPVGCCDYSDICVFSFHPVKIITTGEGGMAMTNDAELAASMQRLRSHGITRDTALFEGEADGPWSYQQIELGYNYRITDLQCALGASQLQRVDAFVSQRHVMAERYDQLLESLPVITPWRSPDSYSAFHLYVIRLENTTPGYRRQVFEAMRASDIGVNVHYIPIHTHPYYRALGFNPGDYPVAEAGYRDSISLPLYYDYTEAEQDTVVNALQKTLEQNAA